jgi:hypothetical protein
VLPVQTSFAGFVPSHSNRDMPVAIYPGLSIKSLTPFVAIVIMAHCLYLETGQTVGIIQSCIMH